MRITIEYESVWQNSFLDGSNNEPLPKGGRGFIGSMKKLKEDKANFIQREISHDTVMGILNRLIGDQRKLYQARKCHNYFFAELESHITFENTHNQSKPVNNEVIYIRNITGSTDQKSFTGMIKGNDPIFSSDYSNYFWGILTLDFEAICQFIVKPDYIVQNTRIFDPLIVLEQLEQFNKLKAKEVTGVIVDALTELKYQFPDIEYRDSKDMVKPIMFYCSALYLQTARLGQHFDLSNALTKSGGISGISKRGFTPKDFMDRFTTGKKKPIWGNPYLLKEKHKGEVTSYLTKANGILEIRLDIPQEKALQVKNMIEAAGVSSFYLGKKGLAYVSNIRV